MVTASSIGLMRPKTCDSPLGAGFLYVFGIRFAPKVASMFISVFLSLLRQTTLSWPGVSLRRFYADSNRLHHSGFALLLAWADRRDTQCRDIDELAWRDALLVSCAQAISLIPGAPPFWSHHHRRIIAGTQPRSRRLFLLLIGNSHHRSGSSGQIDGAWLFGEHQHRLEQFSYRRAAALSDRRDLYRFFILRNNL